MGGKQVGSGLRVMSITKSTWQMAQCHPLDEGFLLWLWDFESFTLLFSGPKKVRKQDMKNIFGFENLMLRYGFFFYDGFPLRMSGLILVVLVTWRKNNVQGNSSS